MTGYQPSSSPFFTWHPFSLRGQKPNLNLLTRMIIRGFLFGDVAFSYHIKIDWAGIIRMGVAAG
jgi:hypothetical protein